MAARTQLEGSGTKVMLIKPVVALNVANCPAARPSGADHEEQQP
jgi:hypothetical protein